MKRIIFTILFILLCSNVYAVTWNEFMQGVQRKITDGTDILQIDTNGKIGVTLDEPIATDTTITGGVKLIDADGNDFDSQMTTEIQLRCILNALVLL